MSRLLQQGAGILGGMSKIPIQEVAGILSGNLADALAALKLDFTDPTVQNLTHPQVAGLIATVWHAQRLYFSWLEQTLGDDINWPPPPPVAPPNTPVNPTPGPTPTSGPGPTPTPHP